ncbi:hypothetical protein [Symmachiella macrocystis]|nr:hypothetical protein [Symmachiella macrocystis]
MQLIRKPSAITSVGSIVTTRDPSVLLLRLAKSAKIAHHGDDERPIPRQKPHDATLRDKACMMNTTLTNLTDHRSRFCTNDQPSRCSRGMTMLLIAAALVATLLNNTASAATLQAGVGKVDVTHPDGLVNDRSYVRALVLKNETTTAAIVTIDVVAIGEIGSIGNDYLAKVRARIEKELGIPPTHVIINASHCHSRICHDIGERTFQAVKQAADNLVPARVGVGHGHEDRVSENRRLIMKDGTQIDVRHAYSLPPDEEVAKVGPIDPEIGVLRVDREDGRTLAVVYNFACHPIQGAQNGGNTADMTGFSSKVIEENLDPGTVALFVQGCGGDINPVFYKDVDHPRNAEPLGNMLGLSTLKAVRAIETKPDDRLKVVSENIALPRSDLATRIFDMEAEQLRLAGSLGGTSLNLKTFIPLVVKYNVAEEFPSYYSHAYLLDKARGRNDLSKLDAENRRNMQNYIRNIHTMEKLTRLNTNLRLLRKHHARGYASGNRTIDVELAGLRIGDFVLTTFPGELTVQIGLNLKKVSPHKHTFVAGYTNGYIYYCPTAEQLKNVGNAQEDSDCLVAPEWQKMYEDKAAELLQAL